jgi:hypothetical protein
MCAVLRLGKLVPAFGAADDPLRYRGFRRDVLFLHRFVNLSSLSVWKYAVIKRLPVQAQADWN